MKTKLVWVSGVLLVGNALAQSGSAGVNWQTVVVSAAGSLITAMLGTILTNNLQKKRDLRVEKLKVYQKLAEELAGIHKEIQHALSMATHLSNILTRVEDERIPISHSQSAYEAALELALKHFDETSKKLLEVQNNVTVYAFAFYNGKGLWVTPAIERALNSHLVMLTEHLSHLRDSMAACEQLDRLPDLPDLASLANLDVYQGLQDQLDSLGKVMALMKKDMHR